MVTWDQTGVNVHWGAEATYDYYLNDHGRNSFDNAGGTIYSYAHADVNYNNAFWDGTRMTYGDGDGVNFTPLVCLDVVGHEITHGVTQNSANLIYWGESGALNESFSDIFGNEVEFMREGVPGVGTGSWRMGEDITPSGSGIRNMQNPNEFNNADTYLGTYWVTTGSGDNGGVHYNSGVQNFWFYLLCEGGSGTNDHGNAYNVSTIGFTKAAAIAYRNLTVYLTPSSNYYAARVGAINSAIDLYGPGSTEVQAVMDAWYAVGVYEPNPPSGILVWEGVLGGRDYSGSYINTYLTNAGYSTHYTNFFPPTLIGYDKVFLSFGNYLNQSTYFDDFMASVLKSYLETGGKVYLEGGDALGWDQEYNTAIHQLFGLSYAIDGLPNANLINNLSGQIDALTEGFIFNSSNQISNTYIDIFSPSTGIVSFVESDYGNVAVQNIGEYGQKTFCFSYALAELNDEIYPSTKNELLSSIINYLDFGVPALPPEVSFSKSSFTFDLLEGSTTSDILTISNIAFSGSKSLRWEISDQNTTLTLKSGIKIPIKVDINSFNNQENLIINQYDYKNISLNSLENNTYLKDIIPTINNIDFPSESILNEVQNLTPVDKILLISSGGEPTDIRNHLLSYIPVVDIFNAEIATPSHQQLSNYPVVILMNGLPFFNSVNLGNILAEYIDSGGGVIVTVPSFVTGFNISGRFLTEGYLPFNISDGPYMGVTNLGSYDDSHPIFNGITTLIGDALSNPSLTSGSTQLATWENGFNCVAIKGSVVGLNIFINSPGYWGGNVPLLISNTSSYLAEINCKWINEIPLSGIVLPGNNEDINLIIDPSSLPAGNYNCNLIVESNDVLQPKVIIPVSLNISPDPNKPNLQIENFDNAVGNFFPDPPVLNDTYWTNGPNAYFNLTNNTDFNEGSGSMQLDYKAEAFENTFGYVVRTTYPLGSVNSIPYIDLSGGTYLSLWYKVTSPTILSNGGQLIFEFKLAEYNDLDQRDLWVHQASIDLLDNTGEWINIIMPLRQDENSELGFAQQFIDGDGILQLDKIKGFEIGIVLLAGDNNNTPTATGTLLFDNLQLMNSEYVLLASPNGGELWKAGIENPDKMGKQYSQEK